ncbi:MAG: hypothetical protein AAGU32_08205 [Bacillota bacterium]
MWKYDPKKIGGRLEKLRDQDSAYIIAKKLNELIGVKGKFVLDGEGADYTGSNGINKVSNHENGKGINEKVLAAYAHIHHVSIEYLLCKTDINQPEYEELREEIGLSDEAIIALKRTIYHYIDMSKARENMKRKGLAQRKVNSLIHDIEDLNYNRITRNKRDQEGIRRLICYVLSDESFWNDFYDALKNMQLEASNPQKLQSPEEDDHSDIIDANKYRVLKRFEMLINACLDTMKRKDLGPLVKPKD